MQLKKEFNAVQWLVIKCAILDYRGNLIATDEFQCDSQKHLTDKFLVVADSILDALKGADD